MTGSELIFYHAPHSRALAVNILLEELGVPFERRVLNLTKNEQRQPAYLAVNPMGKVPAIVHNGALVTEQVAIFIYLADAFPSAGLAPALADRADYYRWMFFAAGPVEQAITAKHFGIEPDADQQRPERQGFDGDASDFIQPTTRLCSLPP